MTRLGQLWAFVLILFAMATPGPRYALAQATPGWLPPQRIPNYEADTWPPILLSDRYGTVHAFSSQWLVTSPGSRVRGIVYNRWAVNMGWTVPVDILVSPLKDDARLLDVMLDEADRLHLAYWGGDGTQAKIYYASADLYEAGQAGAWSAPLLVAEFAQEAEVGAIYADDSQFLVILFSGRQTGSGLYGVRSEDGGLTWSAPALLFRTIHEDNFIHALSIARTEQGIIHAIWNEVTPAGQGRGIYYARTETSAAEWSAPVRLAQAEEGYGTNTPAIFGVEGEVLALYNLGGIVLQRTSTDGKNWSPPRQVFARHVGVNGSLSLVADAGDRLHVFLGQRISGSPDIHGMWHSVFDGTRWTEPEAVVSGPPVHVQQGDAAFDPFEARAVVSQGNVLLVTWRTDPGLKGNGVWYSYQRLDAAGWSENATAGPAPLITPQPVPSETPSALPTVGGVETETPASMAAGPGSAEPNNPGLVLLVGLAPVILLVSVLFGAAMLKRSGFQ